MAYIVDGIDYANRMRITLLSAYIDSNLTWFPIPVVLTSANFDFSLVRADGTDIRFVDAGGGELAYEVVNFDQAGESALYWVSATGWVISSSGDVDFYMVYGKADDAADHSNPTGVWDNNFKAVYHMDDPDTGVLVDDSTTQNDGAKLANAEPSQVTGMLYKAQDFDGSDDYVTLTQALADMLELKSTGWSLEMLLKPDAATTGHFLGSVAPPWVDEVRTSFGAGGVYFSYYDEVGCGQINAHIVGAGDLRDAWHYYALTCGVNDLKSYLDDQTYTGSGDVSGCGNLEDLVTPTLGVRKIGNSPYGGLIEEVRLSDVVRAAAWLKATYYACWGNLVSYDTARDDVPTGFTILETLGNKIADQGVCSDGTYLYATSSTTIYKYNKAGVLQDSHANVHSDHGTACTQINGVFEKDGTLYITAYTTNGLRDAYVKEFLASDLSYVTEHPVGVDSIDFDAEGCGYYDSAWWVIYNRRQAIRKYDSSWNFVAQYDLTTFTRTGDTGFNGVHWIGTDLLMVNSHEDNGGYGEVMFDIYRWTGSEFIGVVRLDPPTHHCTQGFGIEPDGGETTIWFIGRNDGGDNVHNIVKATINYKGTIYAKNPTKDNSIDLNVPNTNYGALGYLFNRAYRAGEASARPVLEFDISDFPTGKAVRWARLKLAYFLDEIDDSWGRKLWAYKLDPDNDGSDWVELESTWNIYAAGENWDTAGGDYVTSNPDGAYIYVPSFLNWMWWDITDIVKDAIRNGGGIVKLLIKDDDEAPGGILQYQNRWQEREHATASLRPVLEIEYGGSKGGAGGITGAAGILLVGA